MNNDKKIIAHIFGKPGCAKCTALKARLINILAKEKYKHNIEMVYHELANEKEFALFARLNLNPNRIPAMLVSTGNNTFIQQNNIDRTINDVAYTFPFLGICTDYSSKGHKGIIKPEMIEEVLDEALVFL